MKILGGREAEPMTASLLKPILTSLLRNKTAWNILKQQIVFDYDRSTSLSVVLHLSATLQVMKPAKRPAWRGGYDRPGEHHDGAMLLPPAHHF